MKEKTLVVEWAIVGSDLIFSGNSASPLFIIAALMDDALYGLYSLGRGSAVFKDNVLDVRLNSII